MLCIWLKLLDLSNPCVCISDYLNLKGEEVYFSKLMFMVGNVRAFGIIITAFAFMQIDKTRVEGEVAAALLLYPLAPLEFT